MADQADYRHLDSAPQTLAATNEITVADRIEAVFGDLFSQGDTDGRDILSSLALSRGTALLVQRLEEANFVELAQVIVMWIQRLGTAMSRRELLSKLSAAFTLAAAAPLSDTFDPDEHERVGHILQDPSTFDEPTLRYCESMVSTLRRQGDTLGPQLTLHSAMGYRDVAQRLTKTAPLQFQQRALSAYAQLTQLVGWLCFNMGGYRSAQHYYNDACSAAHDAQNVELATYVLCTMSHLATWQGKPRVGLDHAIVAQAWAAQTGNPLAEAYAADVAARAFAADCQADPCRKMLDTEQTAVAKITAGTAEPLWWYFYDESFFWATTSDCALQLRDPQTALETVSKSLATADPTNVHNYAFTLLFQSEAFVQQGHLAEACQTIGEVAMLTATNRSQRIGQRIAELRAALTPWQRSKPVRELDELLVAYSSSSRRSGST
ncbi:MAG TPA: hypothetical protein VIY28_15490 [Pseudonocardiaceae bacterium]